MDGVHLKDTVQLKLFQFAEKEIAFDAGVFIAVASMNGVFADGTGI